MTMCNWVKVHSLHLLSFTTLHCFCHNLCCDCAEPVPVRFSLLQEKPVNKRLYLFRPLLQQSQITYCAQSVLMSTRNNRFCQRIPTGLREEQLVDDTVLNIQSTSLCCCRLQFSTVAVAARIQYSPCTPQYDDGRGWMLPGHSPVRLLHTFMDHGPVLVLREEKPEKNVRISLVQFWDFTDGADQPGLANWPNGFLIRPIVSDSMEWIKITLSSCIEALRLVSGDLYREV